MTEQEAVVCMDVGGTEIKAAPVGAGGRLRDALLPFLRDFRPDCLCLGGQITKSAALFLAPLQNACGALGTRLHVAADTSQTALQGLSVLGTH